jgi:hypothetical protein
LPIAKNLATSLDRADEILKDLLAEYDACLHSKSVSGRALQLTHDICVLLCRVLDRTARKYWETHVSSSLPQKDRDSADIYFPVATNVAGVDSTLGRWRWKAVRAQHQDVCDYIIAQQPFSNGANSWLAIVKALSNAAHVDLVPQTKVEERRITVTGAGGGSVSWGHGVTFGAGVSIMGAPVDPKTQRIVPTQGVTERIETWVSFNIQDHNVNAAGLCKEACEGTQRIVKEMSDKFCLS